MERKILTCFNLKKCFLHILCTKNPTWYTLTKIKLTNVIHITLIISEILIYNSTINALIIRIQVFFLLLFSLYTFFHFKLHIWEYFKCFKFMVLLIVKFYVIYIYIQCFMCNGDVFLSFKIKL
jgi:hypothetical protein